MKRIYIPIMVLFIVASCTSSKKTQADVFASEEHTLDQQGIVPDTFVLPAIPATITQPNARSEYLSMHFWDRFDFKNRELIDRTNITEQALVDYINVLNYIPQDKVPQSIAYTLKKAEADSAVYLYFTTLFDKYLYNPNSPFRNEEFYIPVLENAIKSPMLSDANKSKYDFQLEMARKNRVGEKAADFSYTLASGHKARLHAIASEYLLMLFIDPDCETCKTAVEHLNQSQAIKNALSMNSPGRTMLSIITIYPDGNVGEWKAHLKSLPDKWINAYDAEMDITKKKRYEIKAYPTIYLLDKDKKVILKDATAEMAESFFAQPH